MSNTSRKIRKNIHKMTQDLLRKLTKPDEMCDICEKDFTTTEIDSKEKLPSTMDVVDGKAFHACYMTCPELYARNKLRHKDLVDKLKAITGDSRI